MPPLGQAGGIGGMAVGTFHEIEKAYFDLRWHLDPVAATQAGVKAYDDRYGRYSPPALAPHLAALKSLAGALEEAAADEREDEIDRTALLNEIRVVLHRFERERPQAKSPAFWLNHLLSGLHFLLGRGDRSDEERARALVGRLEDVPRLLDDARVALAEPVRVFVETALRINAGGLGLVRGIAAAIPDAPPGPGDALREAVEQAAEAMTAFDRDLERWLETASEEFALGEDDFNFQLRRGVAQRVLVVQVKVEVVLAQRGLFRRRLEPTLQVAVERRHRFRRLLDRLPQGVARSGRGVRNGGGDAAHQPQPSRVDPQRRLDEYPHRLRQCDARVIEQARHVLEPSHQRAGPLLVAPVAASQQKVQPAKQMVQPERRTLGLR